MSTLFLKKIEKILNAGYFGYVVELLHYILGCRAQKESGRDDLFPIMHTIRAPDHFESDVALGLGAFALVSNSLNCLTIVSRSL